MVERTVDLVVRWLKTWDVEASRAPLVVLSRYALDMLAQYRDGLIARGCWHLRESIAAAMVVLCWLGGLLS